MAVQKGAKSAKSTPTASFSVRLHTWSYNYLRSFQWVLLSQAVCAEERFLLSLRNVGMSHILLLSWAICINIKREDLTWYCWYFYKRREGKLKGLFPLKKKKKKALQAQTISHFWHVSKTNKQKPTQQIQWKCVVFPWNSFKRRVIKVLGLTLQRTEFERVANVRTTHDNLESLISRKKTSSGTSLQCTASSLGKSPFVFAYGWEIVTKAWPGAGWGTHPALACSLRYPVLLSETYNKWERCFSSLNMLTPKDYLWNSERCNRGGKPELQTYFCSLRSLSFYEL